MSTATITITHEEEHADIRHAMAAIRAVVKDPRDRERVEAEFFAALMRSGRIKPVPKEMAVNRGAASATKEGE